MVPTVFGREMELVSAEVSWKLDLGNQEWVYVYRPSSSMAPYHANHWVAHWGTEWALEEYYPLPHLSVKGDTCEEAIRLIEEALKALKDRLTVLVALTVTVEAL